MYENGRGVPKDYIKAAEVYKKAAEQGALYAQHNLGIAYREGRGVQRDPVLAYAWLNLATIQENESSLAEIARIRLTPADLAEAQRLSSNWKPGQSIEREKK